MRPLDIINRYYDPSTRAFRILREHGELVAERSLKAAARVGHLKPDLAFIRDAAMLHDIAIFLTDSPGIGCHGAEPYVRHGILGRDILDALGMPSPGLVCERHVGVGISAEDIRCFNLPLPVRDMRPVTIEEQIICYADKFFSKNGSGAPREKTVAEIVGSLSGYGADKVDRFMGWVELFG
jgi:uncharacterized protein